MSSPASGSLRGLRVALIAVAGTLLAAAAHVAAGGRLPGAGATVAAAVVPAIGGLWLSRRRRGWVSIAAVLGGVQVVLHSWLMSTTAATGCFLHAAGGHVAHAAAAVPIRCTAAPPMPGMRLQLAPAVTGTGTSAAMLVAHTVAVLVTALVLAAGERALWQLLHWLRPALQVVLAVLPVLPQRVPSLPVRTVPVHWHAGVVLGGPGRRGPPVLVGVR